MGRLRLCVGVPVYGLLCYHTDVVFLGSLDLSFWYNSAFGSPVGRVQGTGYVQELVARLTQERIKEHRLSTNATLDDDPTTFPFGNSLYVDATHEVVVLISKFRASLFWECRANS